MQEELDRLRAIQRVTVPDAVSKRVYQRISELQVPAPWYGVAAAILVTLLVSQGYALLQQRDMQSSAIESQLMDIPNNQLYHD